MASKIDNKDPAKDKEQRAGPSSSRDKDKKANQVPFAQKETPNLWNSEAL